MQRCLIALVFLRSITALASGDAVSPAFRFDATYLSTATSRVWEVAQEAAGLSALFTAKTVEVALDTDGDGLPDAWEIAHALNPNLQDSALDSDNDGRSNLSEYNAGTDPTVPDLYPNAASSSSAFLADLRALYEMPTNTNVPVEVWALSSRFLADMIGISPDTDGDGMRDDWETAHGLDPLVNDSALDADGDGRTNLQEYNAGTDPQVRDDWACSRLASSAFLTDTHIPYVPGNLPLTEETYVICKAGNVFVCDTGGLYYDWDGDGIPNWWEARFASSKTALTANLDADGDGYSNAMEYQAYTDPTNRASVFTISKISPKAQASTVNQALAISPALYEEQAEPAVSSLLLTWLSAANRRYRVYTSTDLLNWSPDPILTVDGTGGPLTVEVPQLQSQQFFRVTVDFIP